MGIFRKKTNNMILYCKAKVIKEPGFNYLKYTMDDVSKNTDFVGQFDNGEIVEIYIRRLKK